MLQCICQGDICPWWWWWRSQRKLGSSPMGHGVAFNHYFLPLLEEWKMPHTFPARCCQSPPIRSPNGLGEAHVIPGFPHWEVWRRWLRFAAVGVITQLSQSWRGGWENILREMDSDSKSLSAPENTWTHPCSLIIIPHYYHIMGEWETTVFLLFGSCWTRKSPSWKCPGPITALHIPYCDKTNLALNDIWLGIINECFCVSMSYIFVPEFVAWRKDLCLFFYNFLVPTCPSMTHKTGVLYAKFFNTHWWILGNHF